MTSLIDYFPPGMTPRPSQTKVLNELEKILPTCDVAVIRGPVGFGKSPCAVAIARWFESQGQSTAILTHRVALQDQYKRAFPEIPTLMGKARYACPTYQMSCADVKETVGGYCGCECKYMADKRATEEAQIANYNYNVYAYLDKEGRSQNIVADEYHALFDILSDMYTLKLWEHKDKYPKGLKTCGDVAVWLEVKSRDLGKDIGRIKAEITRLQVPGEDPVPPPPEMAKELKDAQDVQRKYSRILKGLQIAPANFFIESLKLPYRGKDMDALQIRPTSLTGLPPILWRSAGIQKIILMSGTSSPLDIAKLGLEGMRIKYIYGDNPIPADRRPVDASWGVNMSYEYQDKNMPLLAARIETLALEYYDSKGLVHLTYGLAQKLRKHLPEGRYLWHTSQDAKEVLKVYLESKEPVILMACGMSEGLDLAGPDYRFQIIAKLPFPSMADKLIAKWAREEPEYYNWLTVRAIEQQVGRISRGPEDYGITHILDSSFGNIPKKRAGLVTRAQKLFSKDFIESINWG